jgi:serine/threonine protein kinase
MESLDAYGLDGCYYISSNVYSVPTWNNLYKLEPYKNKNIYTIVPPLHNLSTVYEIGSILATGTYGKVYHAKRFVEKEARSIVIKENETTSTSSYTLHEAILHAIVHKTFTKIGLGCVIPELYEVTTRKDKSLCMAMEWVPGSTLLDYFYIYLTRITNASTLSILPESLEIARRKNDTLLLDILVQVAIYLTILQKKLQFNHRDLKVNNILIRHTSARSRTILRRLDHPLLSKPWECRYDVVVIDFGFSCMVGSSPFEAGNFFKLYPPSMKSGQDLALLIYSIHAFFPLNQYISPSLYSFLHSCTMIGSISLLNGIQTDGMPCAAGSKIPFDEGIYHFLQKDSSDLNNCDPSTFLKNLDTIL